MKSKISVIIFLLLFFTIGGEVVIAQTAKQKSIGSLVGYLYELGETYNCFFTLEDAWKKGESTSPFFDAYLKMKPIKGNLQQILINLSQAVPNFSFTVNAINPNIIHIIDERLRSQKGYSLDSTIKSINFDGQVRELAAAINNQGIAIAQETSYMAGDPYSAYMDFTTVIQVQGTSLKVREALSNYIPLNGYSRIIWTATTKLGPGEVTYINYRGHRIKKKKER